MTGRSETTVVVILGVSEMQRRGWEPAVGQPAPWSATFYLSGMTFPWEVPPDTIVVEYVDGHWRVVPYTLPVEIFRTREEAIARAVVIANLFLNAWRIVEKPGDDAATRSA